MEGAPGGAGGAPAGRRSGGSGADPEAPPSLRWRAGLTVTPEPALAPALDLSRGTLSSAVSGLIDQLALLIQRGGYVMIPLLCLSVASLALLVERAWFWLRTTRAPAQRRQRELSSALRRGDARAALTLLAEDHSPAAAVVRDLLERGASDAVAIEAVEAQRPRLDRFMVSLSTIITAAPLLGILGTVIGIIQSFNLLGQEATLEDPRVVSAGIAQALLTTALGLVVALVTLFPYMILKGQSAQALGRLESLIASAQEGRGHAPRGEQAPGRPGRATPEPAGVS
jgi:biopolymer transport protein ExbB